jgi:hypothetical protein
MQPIQIGTTTHNVAIPKAQVLPLAQVFYFPGQALHDANIFMLIIHQHHIFITPLLSLL